MKFKSIEILLVYNDRNGYLVSTNTINDYNRAPINQEPRACRKQIDVLK